MANSVLSADAEGLDLEWVHGDAVGFVFGVKKGHTSGWTTTYTSQVREASSPTSDLFADLTILAQQYNALTHGTFGGLLDADDTVVTITLSGVDSEAVPMPEAGGDLVARWDMRTAADKTRLRGRVTIKGRVTV